MATKRLGRRQALAIAGGSAAALGLGLWLVPSSKEQTTYPFVRRLGGARDPLWRIAPEKLYEATVDDARRLTGFAEALGKAVTRVEEERGVLENELVDALGPNDRKKIREIWWQLFEPILAMDDIKRRYQGFYGLDYVAHPFCTHAASRSASPPSAPRSTPGSGCFIPCATASSFPVSGTRRCRSSACPPARSTRFA